MISAKRITVWKNFGVFGHFEQKNKVQLMGKNIGPGNRGSNKRSNTSIFFSENESDENDR